MALTAPFTLGNVLRIMGNRKLYLKNATIIEQLAKVDTIVFDKTGTITTHKKSSIVMEGTFSEEELVLIKNVLRGSNHPLSRRLYDFLPAVKKLKVDDFKELTGQGIQGTIEGKVITIGSASFVEFEDTNNLKQTIVHVSIDSRHLVKFIFNNQYRDGLELLFQNLNRTYQLKVLSGDNDGERAALEHLLPKNTELIFNQTPEQKLEFIKNLQKEGKNVMMVGDGLNDAGALAQSNIGVSISENVNVFLPACDGILDASQFEKISFFLKYSKNAMRTIYMSFGLSLLYNIIGLSFAISGNLLPIVAAIIMPLSTITIIGFVTIMSNYYARNFKL